MCTLCLERINDEDPQQELWTKGAAEAGMKEEHWPACKRGREAEGDSSVSAAERWDESNRVRVRGREREKQRLRDARERRQGKQVAKCLGEEHTVGRHLQVFCVRQEGSVNSRRIAR